MSNSLQERLAAIEAGEGVVSKEKSVAGEIAKLFFSSPEFSTGTLRTSDYKTIKFSGRFMVNIGDRIKLFGKWVEHPKFGWQFEAGSFEHNLVMDADGLSHYLNTNPNFVGIGPVKAEKIARAFAHNFDKVITETPEKIRQTAGLSEKQLTILRVEWEKRKRVNSISSWLGKFGLTHNQVEKLTTKYGDGIKSILDNNPYILYREVDGYGFYRADQIALKLGYEKNHPGRIQSAILYTVDQQTQNGDCWTEEQVLINLVEKALALDDLNGHELISDQLEGLLKEDSPRLTVYHTSGRFLIANTVIYRREKELFEKFKSVADCQVVSPVEEKEEITDCLTSSQQQAVHIALTNKITVISGAAGSGKSFTLSTINQLCEEAELSVAMCAPTGKAAKRMEELSGKEAYTIHRLLDYSPREGWRINGDNPLEADVVIVDECFDYKQPIMTENGWEYIGVIVNNHKTVRVWSRNPKNGQLELKPIVRWIKNPAPENILKISAGRSGSMRSARIIRCTTDHKILTPYGYRSAGDLCVGEEVVVRGYQFTSEQRSILIGSILGDGSMNAKNGRTSPQIVITHGDDQKEFLDFKRRAMGVLAGKIQRGKSGYTDNLVWRLAINVVDETYEIAKEIVISGRHPSGRRRWTPTNNFLELIDEQALTIWFLDNGSLRRQKLVNGGESVYATIHSERFSEEDNYRLANHLCFKFGLSPKVSDDSRGNYLLRFNKKETARLLNIILPFTPSCMKYKVSGEAKYKYEPTNQIETTIARIQKIEPIKPTSAFVYDVEVSDNHNYVAGNIIVSNCSMVDINLAWHLFDAIDLERTKVILVGDHNQLPPVGPGNLLRDLLDRKIVPVVVLDQVIRQAGTLKENSTDILSGQVQPTAPGTKGVLRPWYMCDYCREEAEVLDELIKTVKSRMAPLGIDPVRDLQILTPWKKGLLGVNNLNIELQRLIQQTRFGVRVEPVPPKKRPPLLKGDKVMQIQNDYDLGVMNGSVGFVQNICMGKDEKGKPCRVIKVDFDGKEVQVPVGSKKAGKLQLAYSCTVHKYQGSEVPCALVIVHSSQSYMLHRNWLYTAVTRARKTAIVLGDKKGIRYAAGRRITEKRKTFMSVFE